MPLSAAWLILPIVLLPITIRKGVVLLAYLLLAGFLIGWWRGGVLQAQNLKYYSLFDKTVSITARATEDSFYADKSQLEFTVESVSTDGQSLPGKIRVRGYGEAMVYRHDIVAVRGKMYPARGSKQASISFAEINVLARAKSPIEDFRRSFIAGMETALPEPAASFGVGLLVGQRSLLPDDILLVLTIVGLTHVVAVSGYNLTIIVRGVQNGLKKLSRFQILFITLGLVYLFLLVTGFSPSIIRAAIVAVLGLLAWYFGRSIRPLLLIALAAAITGFANPYYVWGDIGWYLSFLAFFGVLVFAPLLTIKLFNNKKAPIVGSVAIESFSAQIMTFPIIMMIFGRISIIGFVANIIIVPMVPLAMLLSLLAGLAGMFLPAISGWVALPARIWLDAMLWIATALSKVPGAQTRANVTVAGLVALYAILAVVILGLRKRAQSVVKESQALSIK